MTPEKEEKIKCKHCTNSDPSLIEVIRIKDNLITYRCDVCSKEWSVKS